MLVVWLVRRDAASDKPTAPPIATRSPIVPPTGSATASTSAEAPTPTAEPTDDGTQPIAPVAAESPYPPGSQPLTEGSDPATTVPEDDPVDPETGVHVVFGPRRDVVHPPDPIVIDVQLLDAHGKRLPIRNGRVYFRTERETNRSGAGAHADVVDDGRGADRVRDDLAYTATFAPSDSDRALLDFRVFVELAFTAGDLGDRRYATWVQYTPKPNGYLDGRYADALVGGSLIVQVGVAVAQRGRFKVIASLYGPDHQTAIAFAQNAMELEAGAQQIPLTFFGKILHDRAIDGPYTVRYAMLFEEFPERGVYWPGVTVDDAYTTHAYRAVDLAPDAYVAPPPTVPEVTAQSPSQQNKPPPLFKR